jgi:hypothetical protein
MLNKIISFSFLFLLLINTILAQTQCPPLGIRTNPEDPINNSVPQWQNNPFINSDFKWFDLAPGATNMSDYQINDNAGFNLPQGHTILNPFSSSMGAEYGYLHNYQNAIDGDHHWEDGWELFSINLGYFPDGSPIDQDFQLSSSATIPGSPTNYDQTPYVILYNRYRGNLRIFATTTTYNTPLI